MTARQDQLGDDAASLLNNLGWAKFEAGDLDEARALFEEAVEEADPERLARLRELGAQSSTTPDPGNA